MKNGNPRNTLNGSSQVAVFYAMLNRLVFAHRGNHLPVENAEEEISELHTVASFGGFCEQG
jgi:hypothetical protein